MPWIRHWRLSKSGVFVATDQQVIAPDIACRLFLVGCPRSGTTLVQSCLGAHPDVLTFTESHFYDKHFRQTIRGRFAIRGGELTFPTRFLEENGIGSPMDRTADLDALRNMTGVDDAARWLIDRLDRECTLKKRSWWIEKTPDHVWRIPLIQRAAPDAKFVHVLRLPAPTIASLYQASQRWGAPKSWLDTFLHWRYSLACSARYVSQRDRHFFVFYEDFVTAPQKCCDQLLQWLGFPPDHELLGRRMQTTHRVINERESWKAGTFEEIRPRATTNTAVIPWSIRRLISATSGYSALYRSLHEAAPAASAEPAYSG